MNVLFARCFFFFAKVFFCNGFCVFFCKRFCVSVQAVFAFFFLREVWFFCVFFFLKKKKF